MAGALLITRLPDGGVCTGAFRGFGVQPV